MRRLHVLWILALVWVGLVACQPQESDPAPLPTLMMLEDPATSEPTAEPDELTEQATPEAALSEPTPRPTNVPVGRFAVDPITMAHFRVVHTAVEVGAVDLYISDVNINRDLRFGDTSPRINIAAGAHTLNITPAGEDIEQSVLVSLPFEIVPGGELLFVVSGDAADTLQVTQVTISSDPLSLDESRVNFVHAVPGYQGVSIALNNIGLAPLINYGQATGVRVVPPLRDAVFTFDALDGSPVAVVSADLRPRADYTFILIGTADNPADLRALTIESEAPGAIEVRVLNVSEEVRNVDVYVGAQLVAQNVETTRLSSAQRLTSGAQNIRVFPAGAEVDANSVSLAPPVQLLSAPDEFYTVIVFGTAESLRVLPVRENRDPVRAGNARIQFVHALPGVDFIEIGMDGSALPEIPPIAYGQTSASFEYVEATLNLFARIPQTDTVVELADNYLLDSARSHLFVVTGRTDSNPIAFSDPVDVDFDLEDTLTDDPDRLPSGIRVLNLIHTQPPINVRFNDRLVVESLLFTGQSEFIEVVAEGVTVTVTDARDESVLLTQTLPIPDSNPYSLFVYGEPGRMRLAIYSDANLILSSETPSLRFINLTLDVDHSFALALGVATDPLEFPSISGTPADPANRPTVPFGVDNLTGAVFSGGISAQTFLFEPQVRDIVIADADNRLAARIRSVDFEAATLYDIIAYEWDTRPVSSVFVYIIPYPRQPR